jgi:hypothetical protein
MSVDVRPAIPTLAPRHGAFRASRERLVRTVATMVTVLVAAAAVVIVAAAAVAFAIG